MNRQQREVGGGEGKCLCAGWGGEGGERRLPAPPRFLCEVWRWGCAARDAAKGKGGPGWGLRAAVLKNGENGKGNSRGKKNIIGILSFCTRVGFSLSDAKGG